MTTTRTLCLVLLLGCSADAEDSISAKSTTPSEPVEVEIPVASLPTPIVNALADKGAIDEAEVVISPQGVAFEVEIGNTEYLVDAQGTILAQEQDDDDDAEGDDD